MKVHILAAAAVLAMSGAAALAAEDNTLSDKITKDNPGTSQPGATANPTAKPDDSSVSQKQMKDAPGVKSQTGATADPTAKPTDSSVSEKQKKDTTGVN